MGWRLALVLCALPGCDSLLGLTAIAKLPPDAPSTIDAPGSPPRAHYTFEKIGATGPCLLDDSGHGHDGTCAQGMPTLVAGPPGHGEAFQLDGATYITIPYAADLDSTSGLTIAMWIAIDSYADLVVCPVNRPVGSTGADTWQLCFASDHGFFYFSDAQVNTPAVASDWVHVALVFDGAHASSWMNGEIISLDLASQPTYDQSIGIWIGADADPTPDVWLSGRIDDLYIYDRVLSPGEIAALAR